MMTEDRVLLLEGVHNFRDYGGYPVAGGGRLKRGMLWRSGQHHGASESDLGKIASLGLTSVFDLRSSRERGLHPCRRPEGFAAKVIWSEDPPARGEHSAPHVAAAQMSRFRDPVSTREGLRRNYSGIPFRPELVAVTRLMIAEAAEGEGAILVNCMAGKDRTGLAVAALHLAAGVHRDDIIEDYLLTNTAGDVEARIAAGIASITASTGLIDEESLRILMGVEAEYLEAAFAAMEEKHGSTDGYLAEVLGVDETLRAKLRDALVEE